jgi:ABC-type branched-subunit amino acid transport system substrate-binding protein
MKRWLVVFVVLSLLFILLPACDGGEEEATSTSIATPTSIINPTATPTITTAGPVKIGAFSVWTGPAAIAGTYYTDPVIKVVEKQVEESGGILGGRPLEIKKYDTGGTGAGALTAATKAVTEDKLSVIAFGGIGGTETTTIAEVACKSNAFYASNAPIFDTPDRKCMVEGTISLDAVIGSMVNVITEQLQPKPQTVAILTMEQQTVQLLINGWKNGYEKAGIKTISEQRLTPGTIDFTPYLTKIKYLDPDVLILYMTTADYMGVAKQIEDLGGWGDIQVVADPVAFTAAKAPGTVGWLTVTPWYLGMDNAESIKYVQDFKAVNGKSPELAHIYYYFCLWTAIHAIELAGTAEDGGAIARAARSGKLEFDTPMGRVHFNADGRADVKLTAIRIEEGGSLVPLK